MAPRNSMALVVSTLLVFVVLPQEQARAAAGCSTTTPNLGQLVTCTAAGTETITVPAGAGTAQVVVTGGGGGSGRSDAGGKSSGAGGSAAVVTAVLNVVAGTVDIKVAAGGGGGGGTTPAGGGGYSSISQDISSVSTPMVIAGGGGGGAQGLSAAGGNGGSGGDGASGGTAAGSRGGTGPGTGNFPGGLGGSDGTGGARSSTNNSNAGANWLAGGSGGAGTSSYSAGGGDGYGGGASGETNNSAPAGASGGGAGGSYANPTYASSVTYSTANRSGVAPYYGAGGLAVTAGSSAENGRAGYIGTVQITFLGSELTPTFDTPIRTSDGFTAQITNYDPSFIWDLSATSGTGSINGSGVLTVTGLTAGSTSTVTVDTSRAGYANGSSTVSGSALDAGLTPSLGTPTSTIDGFTVSVNNYDPHFTWSVSTDVGSATIDVSNLVTVAGLFAGESATVTVETAQAGYAPGSSTSTASAIPGAPSAPTGVVGTAGNSSVSVTWGVPVHTGGSAITTYEVTSSPGAATCSTSTTSCTVTGLTNGTSYTFTVTAANSVNTSSPSSPSAAVTPAVPAPPQPSNPGGGSTPASEPAESSVPTSPAVIDNGPASVAPPSAPGVGVVSASVNGSAVTIREDSTGSQITLSGNGWTTTITGVDNTRSLTLNSGELISMTGSGGAPGGIGNTYVYSQPTLLGTYVIAADGTYATSIQVPASIDAGNHTLQINTPLTSGDVLTVNLGVVIAQKVTRSMQSVKVMVPFISGSWRLSSAAKKMLRGIARDSREAQAPVTYVSARLTPRGATAANRKLAQQRETQICSYLRSVNLSGRCVKKTWILKPGKEGIGPNNIVRLVGNLP